MAKVYSSNNRSTGNRGFTQVEPLITPKQLKERYLFGVEIVDNAGNELPDRTLQNYINNAVSMLEHDLDIFIMPREVEEQKDYEANDYFHWGYLQLNRFPLISVNALTIAYVRDLNITTDMLEENAVLDIPLEWIRLDGDTGILRLVPNNKFPARLQVESGGAFFPELFRRHGHVPELWIVNYTAGFKDGCIPVLLNQAIGLLASVQALSIAGNLVLGAGIAGSSLSIDGLSQSIQTTQSAENSAYSATRKEYADQIFGSTKDDPFSIIRILRNYYKGSMINIV
jgi:hypothetical protein